MKKVVNLKGEKTRVLVPGVPAVTEKYAVDVPKTVWICDYEDLHIHPVKPSLDEYRHCIGCGKHACYFCLDKVFEELEFEIGDHGYRGDCYSWQDVPPSPDYRSDSFRICKECQKNPPERIKTLMIRIRALRNEEHIVDVLCGTVIDEIELLDKDYKKS